MNNLSINVSIFNPTGNIPGTINPEQLSLTELVEAFQGRWKNEVQNVRNAIKEFGRNSTEHRNSKSCIPAFTLSVECNSRKQDQSIQEKLINYNYLMQIDLDLHSDNIIEWKTKLSKDPHFTFIGISPSGDGLKAAMLFSVPVEVTPDNIKEVHKKAFFEIDEYLFKTYGFHNDSAVKDPFRLCYGLWDEDIQINFDVVPCPLKFLSVEKEEVKEVVFEGRGFISKICDNVKNAKTGTIHDTILKSAYLLGGRISGFGYDELECQRALEQAVLMNKEMLKDSSSIETEFKAIRDGLENGKKKTLKLLEPKLLQKVFTTLNISNPEEIKKYIVGREELDAELLHIMFGERVTFVPEIGLFFVFENGVWKSHKFYGEFFKHMLASLKELYLYCSDDKETLKKVSLLGGAVYSENVFRVLRREKHTSFEDFDKKPHLINFKNGTFDVSKNEFRDHQSTDYLTKIIDFNYNPKAECPEFNNFVSLMFSDNGFTDEENQEIIAFLNYQMGFFITGFNPNRLTIAIGNGLNGKSMYYGIFQKLLGEFSRQSSPKQLFGDKSKTYLAELVSSRFVVCSEMSENQLLSDTLKEIVNTDIKESEKKFGDPINFYAQYAMVVYTNNKPKFKDESFGFERRMLFLPFLHKFPVEETSRENKWYELYLSEAEGILAAMVKSAVEWQDKHYEQPDVIKTFTKENYTESMVGNSLSEFMSETDDFKFEPHSTAIWMSVSDFNLAYVMYCHQNKLEKLNQMSLSSKLKSLGYLKDTKWIQKDGKGKMTKIIYGVCSVAETFTKENRFSDLKF